MNSFPETSSNIEWFRNAAPYINEHRGKIAVIYFSGSCVPVRNFESLIYDIALLHSLGIKIIIVYGARAQIENRLSQENITSKFQDDLRITGKRELEAIVQASSSLRVKIEALLTMSMAATPMARSKIKVVSGNYIVAKPYGVRNGVDFKFTGEVRRVETAAISKQLEDANCVLLTPLGYSPTGKIYNLNALDVAAKVASEINADKFILIYKKALPKNAPTHLRPRSKVNFDWAKKINQEFIDYVRAGNKSVVNGVSRAHILSLTEPSAIITELFTARGSGCMITSQQYERIRPAELSDVDAIVQLIKKPVENGELKPRTSVEIARHIKNYFVLTNDNKVLACAALIPGKSADYVELACVAVNEDFRGGGIAKTLLEELEKICQARNIQHLVMLSTQSAEWFSENGFEILKSQRQLPKHIKIQASKNRNSKIGLKRLFD